MLTPVAQMPLAIYTFDFFYGQYMDDVGLCVFKDLPNSTNAVEYLQLFHKGLKVTSAAASVRPKSRR
jgi:hypothetical protein